MKMKKVSIAQIKQAASNKMYETLTYIFLHKGNCQFTQLFYLNLMNSSGYADDISLLVLNEADTISEGKSYSILQYVNQNDESMIILTSTFDYPLIESL